MASNNPIKNPKIVHHVPGIHLQLEQSILSTESPQHVQEQQQHQSTPGESTSEQADRIHRPGHYSLQQHQQSPVRQGQYRDDIHDSKDGHYHDNEEGGGGRHAEDALASSFPSPVGGSKKEKPSNEKLLSIAFVSFMSFAIAQTVVAFVAGSEAMMGDSAAMMVDALTYLFNLLAERKKAQYKDDLESSTSRLHNAIQEQTQEPNVPTLDPETAARIHALRLKRFTLQLELIPPLISVSTLLVVTAVVLRESISLLITDAHRDKDLQSDPNLKLMLLFSFLNLLLDVVNVGCFARADHALGYDTKADDRSPTEDNDNDDDDDMAPFLSQDDQQGEGLQPLEIESSTPAHDHASDDDKHTPNLNMCSAYTHVFADTLRSLAVILAALIAEFSDAVTSEVADAAAAVVVSALILLSLCPLMSGLVQTFRALQRVRAQEHYESFGYEDILDSI